MTSVGRKMKSGWKKFKKLFSRKPKRTEVICIETITSTDASQPTQDATNQIVEVASNANNDSVGEGVLANDAAIPLQPLQQAVESPIAKNFLQDSSDNQFYDSWRDWLGEFLLEGNEDDLYDVIYGSTVEIFGLWADWFPTWYDGQSSDELSELDYSYDLSKVGLSKPAQETFGETPNDTPSENATEAGDTATIGDSAIVGDSIAAGDSTIIGDSTPAVESPAVEIQEVPDRPALPIVIVRSEDCDITTTKTRDGYRTVIHSKVIIGQFKSDDWGIDSKLQAKLMCNAPTMAIYA